VNRVLKQFVQARKLMKQFGGAGASKMMKRLMGGRMAQFR
jgi:hypothetical protein